MTLLSRCKYLLTGSISYSLYTLSRSNGFCTQCHSPICTRLRLFLGPGTVIETTTTACKVRSCREFLGVQHSGARSIYQQRMLAT